MSADRGRQLLLVERVEALEATVKELTEAFGILAEALGTKPTPDPFAEAFDHFRRLANGGGEGAARVLR